MLDRKDLTYLEVVKPMDTVKIGGEVYKVGDEDRIGSWVRVRGWVKVGWKIDELEGEITGVDYKNNILAISGERYQELLLSKVISMKWINEQKRTGERIVYIDRSDCNQWTC